MCETAHGFTRATEWGHVSFDLSFDLCVRFGKLEEGAADVATDAEMTTL